MVAAELPQECFLASGMSAAEVHAKIDSGLSSSSNVIDNCTKKDLVKDIDQLLSRKDKLAEELGLDKSRTINNNDCNYHINSKLRSTER